MRIVNEPQIVAAPQGVRNLPMVRPREVNVTGRRVPPAPGRTGRPAENASGRGRLVDIVV